jgi:selenide, water dikinase
LGPADLNKALSGLPLLSSPNLIVGMERIEDAGVYQINEETAMVQTVDFFTPIVDDPFTFGQIAAANSLSDVYSMGGKPVTAMNIVCFPIQTMDVSILREILLGGIEKMREAEVVLVGGHSVDDQELKYGLSVTGLIHPQKVLRKEGSQCGDKLVLTKPLGTGIISTAVKGGLASQEASARIIKSMSTLNRMASEVMLETGVHACTDITGFGLAGHALEMIDGTDKGIVVFAGAMPVFPETRELAEMGMVPGGLYRNRDYRKHLVDIQPGVNEFHAEIIFDPQTSGGLLIAVAADKADLLLTKLHQAGVAEAAVIGEVVDKHPGRMVVRGGV